MPSGPPYWEVGSGLAHDTTASVGYFMCSREAALRFPVRPQGTSQCFLCSREAALCFPVWGQEMRE